MHESYSTNRLPCIVCQVKSIQCFYKNDLSSCEACRKSKIRCIKQMPLGQKCQISLPSINASVEPNSDLGKSGRSGTMQHRSAMDPTRDTRVSGPTIPLPNSYPNAALNCPKCEKTDNCARCPGPDGYRFLCEICEHQHLACKLGNPPSNAQPPIRNHRAHQLSPALIERTEVFNSDDDVAAVVVGSPGTASLQHLSAGKKRSMSASVATWEDQEDSKRAKNREMSRKYQVRTAREYEELMRGNEGLRAEMGLWRNTGGGGG